MWKKKACPKCNGDVFVDWDIYAQTWYEKCLQCGYSCDLPTARTSRFDLSRILE